MTLKSFLTAARPYAELLLGSIVAAILFWFWCCFIAVLS